MSRYGVDSSGSGQRLLGGSCEHGNDPLRGISLTERLSCSLEEPHEVIWLIYGRRQNSVFRHYFLGFILLYILIVSFLRKSETCAVRINMSAYNKKKKTKLRGL
jgi:hypothetical protein